VSILSYGGFHSIHNLDCFFSPTCIFHQDTIISVVSSAAKHQNFCCLNLTKETKCSAGSFSTRHQDFAGVICCQEPEDFGCLHLMQRLRFLLSPFIAMDHVSVSLHLTKGTTPSTAFINSNGSGITVFIECKTPGYLFIYLLD
jgi:hypothetical protein